LLDGNGRLLQIFPPNPSLIGQDMTVSSPHLRAAVAGHFAVSQMGPSPSTGVPVASIAMPFESSVGPRVFSGAFSPSTTPLGSYLNAVVSIAAGSTYLVDHSGNVLAAGSSSKTIGATPTQLGVGIRGFDTKDEHFTAAVADVPGLPWRVVLVTPTAGLFAPVDHGGWAPWAMWFAFAVSAFVALLLFFRLARARADASLSARTDHLTALPNRRAMQEELNRAAARAVRHDLPLAALMIDIDRFKLINDAHGHDVGDVVIRATADALGQATREGDVAGRWGGEEFLVLLPHTEYEGVVELAERVRATIAAATVPECPACSGMTVSIGFAMLEHGDTAALLREADTALYVAKANGRNRVEGRTPDRQADREPMLSDSSPR
jgi:diguanylate cyclase (GGDEF)-like protein